MGIRETLNKKPSLAIGIAVAAVVIAIALIVTNLSSGGGRSDRAFFTTDDGQTWFVDDADKLAPFMHEGKEAVRAYVYECDGKEFVNHLMRYTPAAKKAIEQRREAVQSGSAAPSPSRAGISVMQGEEFKKPGDKDWIAGSNLARSGPILQAKCPDGGEAILVEP